MAGISATWQPRLRDFCEKPKLGLTCRRRFRRRSKSVMSARNPCARRWLLRIRLESCGIWGLAPQDSPYYKVHFSGRGLGFGIFAQGGVGRPAAADCFLKAEGMSKRVAG